MRCLGRDHNPSNDDPVEGVLKAKGYTFLGTELDGGDNDKARAKAQEAIINHPRLACVVGLFAYNPPILLDEVRRAQKLKKIKIVGFDEDDATLKGIADGEIVGTVVQDPYKYGYESVRLLAALAEGIGRSCPRIKCCPSPLAPSSPRTSRRSGRNSTRNSAKGDRTDFSSPHSGSDFKP